MEKYDHKKPCIKCGELLRNVSFIRKGSFVGLAYQNVEKYDFAELDEHGNPIAKYDYIYVFCKVCGYEWRALPHDNTFKYPWEKE
jgi:hypothetical protein